MPDLGIGKRYFVANIQSNMSGTVLRILVKAGDKISVDQDVVVLESMKMEMMVPASHAGTVKEVHVAVDDFVQEGQTLITLA
jgi:acetyl-CoA carboxylase biotin carboxyl carrier protein